MVLAILPEPDEEKIKQAVLRLPASDLARFDSIAKKRRMSREALLRECVLEKIEGAKT